MAGTSVFVAALLPIQEPVKFFVHFVSTLIFIGLKRPWCKTDDSLPSSAEGEICVSGFRKFKCRGS
jgi:hypothetical protein